MTHTAPDGTRQIHCATHVVTKLQQVPVEEGCIVFTDELLFFPDVPLTILEWYQNGIVVARTMLNRGEQGHKRFLDP